MDHHICEADRKKQPPTPELKAGLLNFQFIESGFLEQAMADPAHTLHKIKGKIDLLTEVWGPSAYMRDINQTFDFIADALKVGGQARILFGLQTKFITGNRELSPEETAVAVARTTGGRLRLDEFWDGGPPNRTYAVTAAVF